MNKITGKAKGEIEVKRFYVNGVSIESKCPKCNHEKIKDFGDDYFSYPVIGEHLDVYFYCEEGDQAPYCDTEWTVKVKLNVEVSLV